MKPEETLVEKAKKNAASEATKHLSGNMIVGLGSGTTAAYAIREIGEKLQRREVNVLAVPTSHQAFMLAVKHKIPTTTLEEHPRLDLTIDGADQIDSKLNLIKGMGGALTREKIVASASQKLVIVADERKKVRHLGENNQPVPIEVLIFAAPIVKQRLERMGGKPVLREGDRKAGPVITDNGNFIIDVNFGLLEQPEELEDKLRSLPGVIGTGIFVDMTDLVYLGKPSGVEKLEKRDLKEVHKE